MVADEDALGGHVRAQIKTTYGIKKCAPKLYRAAHLSARHMWRHALSTFLFLHWLLTQRLPFGLRSIRVSRPLMHAMVEPGIAGGFGFEMDRVKVGVYST